MQVGKSDAVKLLAFGVGVLTMAISPFSGVLGVNATSNIQNFLYKPSLQIEANQYGLFENGAENSENLYIGNKNDEFLQEITLPGYTRTRREVSENGRYVLYSTLQGMKMFDLSEGVLLGGFIDNYFEYGTNFKVSANGDVVVLRNYYLPMSDVVESPFGINTQNINLSQYEMSQSTTDIDIQLYKIVDGVITHITTQSYAQGVQFLASARSFNSTGRYIIVSEYVWGYPCGMCTSAEVLVDLETMDKYTLHTYSSDINSNQKQFQSWWYSNTLLISERTSVDSFKVNVFNIDTKTVTSSFVLSMNKPTNGFTNSYVHDFIVDVKSGATFVYYIVSHDVFQNNRNRTVSQIGRQASVMRREMSSGQTSVIYTESGATDTFIHGLKANYINHEYRLGLLYFNSFNQSKGGYNQNIYNQEMNRMEKTEPMTGVYFVNFFTKNEEQTTPSIINRI